MKIIILKIAEVFLNLLYSFFKLLPVKKKITYISRQMRTTPKDFQLIAREMKTRHPEYENVFLIKMIDPGIPSKVSYCFHMLKQMYHVATSEMVILDTYCIVVSFLKQRENLKVIQIWHAMGSLKKFGLSILDTKEGSDSQLASAMRMHKNYSYVFCSSEYSKPYFAQAFGVKEEQMVVMPLPRLDLLNNKAYSEKVTKRLTTAYPQLQDKSRKVVVYAPTFRKDERELKEAIENMVEKFDHDHYQLVLSLHPLSDISIKKEEIIQDKSFDTVDLCRIADLIVLDYSAVLFEIVNLNKPVVFYDFDYESYVDKRSFYMDYKKEMPGPICDCLEDLLEYIHKGQYENEKLLAFKEQMVLQHPGKTYTSACLDFIEDILKIQK